MKVLIDTLTHYEFEEFVRGGKITRLDAALDLKDKELDQVIVLSRGKKKHGVYSGANGKPETSYLGTMKSARVVAYNKKIGSTHYLRVETRPKPGCLGKDLVSISNPFKRVRLLPAEVFEIAISGVPGRLIAECVRPQKSVAIARCCRSRIILLECGMRTTVIALSLLAMMCGLAMARPRDDVMINAYRCAGQPSTRVWLDCYYGAAQPQRAALGLGPVPAAQTRLSQTPSAPGAPQDAPARDAVMAAAGRCGSALGERAWLDCYYAAADPVRAVLGLTTRAPAAAVVAAQPAAMAHARPDLLGHVDGRPVTVSVSRMASYRFSRNGIFTVTLENGQVWQQLDGDNHVARWSKDARSYSVSITTGAFKSFNLTVAANPTVYKVRRIS